MISTEVSGSKLLRREDDALLRGRGQFVHNLSLPDLLHIAFARSDHAAGLILDLDTSDAKAMPGVVAVLGIQDLGRHLTPTVNPLLEVKEGLRSPLLADSEVTSVGQILAVVVASSAAAAASAAQAVRLKLSVAQKSGQDLGGASPKLCSDFESEEVAAQVAFRAGVVADPQAQKVSVSLASPRVQAMAMEPRASMAQWNQARQHLTMWMGTQTPSRAQGDLAIVLGLDVQQVRVITPDVGGAFGAKASIYPEDLLLALSARYLKANLRWLGSRSEEFISAMHGRASELKGSLAFSPQGELLELKAELHFTLGAWMPFSAVVPLRNAARILPGPYRIEGVDIRGKASLSNAAPVNIYRGAGRPEAALLMETLVEQAARALHLDPIELRRRNLIPIESMPKENFRGVWAANLTPFDASLRFDEAAYRSNLKHWIETLKLGGLFVAGKQAEFFFNVYFGAQTLDGLVGGSGA